MKPLLIFAFALLAFASCKKVELEPTKRVVGFKFTCAKPFDAKAVFDGQTKEIKGDSGVVYMEFEYVEGNESDPWHTYQVCANTMHDLPIRVQINSSESRNFESSISGPGQKCNAEQKVLLD